jgi:hypothetical protein
MKKRSRGTRRESGYALMLAVFLTALLLLTTLVAAPSIRTERQREKEEEMIWRGKQYVRAIKLYYRKNGRFPTSMEDLTKPKMGSLRFLRHAYKDPMNTEDGTWRLIYVGPAGQLVGSLKPPQTLQLPGVAGTQRGTAGAALGGFGTPPGAQQSANPAQPGQPAQAASGTQPGATAPGTAPDAGGSGAAADGSTPDAALAAETPTIVGGNIIGVGSKINKRSVIVYEKGKNYRLFEFIWDPSKDTLTIGGQPGMQVGVPGAPGQGPGQGFGPGLGGPGQSTFGTQPGNPTNNPMPQPNVPPLTPNAPPPQP